MSGCSGSTGGQPSEDMPDRDQPVEAGGEECAVTVLEIVDRDSGAVVSDTTQTKIVGQRVSLEVRTRPAGRSMTNIQWTIAGERVSDYAQSSSRATRTDLAAGDLDSATVDYYYIAGGNRQVSVSATVNGTALTASMNYGVLAPTGVAMTSATGAVAVGNPGFPGSGLEFHYGTNATPGIEWTLTCTAPAGGAGEIAGTQLVSGDRTRTLTAGGTVETRSSGGAWQLDNTVPYDTAVAIAAGASATWTSSDSPGTPLTATWTRKTVDQDFRIYFMYKPSGADSIWVTLMRLGWDWAGQTARTGAAAANTWGAPTGVSNARNPSGAASTELPTWTSNVSTLPWR